MIRPVLIDREMPRLQARLDELSKAAGLAKNAAPNQSPANEPDSSTASGLSTDQQKEFVEVATELKLLDDRRRLLLARTGDDYVTDPPKLPAKP